MPKTWTTRALLDWTASHFDAKGIESPRRCAEELLAHVLSTPRLKLYMDMDRPATDLERAAFRALVERAVEHEPVDYLVGRAPFFTLDFAVNPHTLIPRPATETLVEHVLQHARVTPGFSAPRIADVGTGSGCIAVTLCKHLPDATAVATDVSADALAVAQQNAETHGVADRIDFRQGDLLDPLAGERLHYLCSNPPYIPDDEWPAVPPNVKLHEPTTALRAGTDGLLFLKPLLASAPGLLHDHGQVCLEHAAAHADDLRHLAEHDDALEHAHTLADHEALPRVLVATRAPRRSPPPA